MTMADWARDLIALTDDAVFLYFVLINTSYLVLVGLAALEFTRHLRGATFSGAEDLYRSSLSPAVTLIVPAHNEGPVIVPAVQALMALRYPPFEVVVGDDGSADDTFDRLCEHFDLIEVPRVVPGEVPHNGQVRSVHVARDFPQLLVVVRKENGGKADALNVGINLARHELVCMVDADSVLDNEALLAV